MNYERLLTYGNIIKLNISCDPRALLKQVGVFPFDQYNTDKPNINRRGLSITSLDGGINGVDLESLRNSEYNELSFRSLTKVYHLSSEIQKVCDPFLPWLGRTHILNIKEGGYFPPHRDDIGAEQEAFRIIVPLANFSSPHHYFIIDDEITNLEDGSAYFVNTNLVHSSFSFSDQCMVLIMNIESCADSHIQVLKHLHDL